jgi:hypothetical protein
LKVGSSSNGFHFPSLNFTWKKVKIINMAAVSIEEINNDVAN